MTKLSTIGALSLTAFGIHGGGHVMRGTAHDILWACNVAAALLSFGCLRRKPLAAAVSLLWLSFGTPMWLLDLMTGGELIATSLLVHVLCVPLGALAVREMGLPKRSWLWATVALLALMLLSRFVTPAASNVNLSHAVHAGWEQTFPRHDVYILMFTVLGAAVFFVAEMLWRRALKKKTK